MKLIPPGAKALCPAVLALLVSLALPPAGRAVTYFNHIIVDPDPGGEPLEKAIADINGDGKKDLIVGMGNAFGVGGMYWWEYPASGVPTDPWIKHTIISTGAFYEHSQIADINGDGFPDIVCSYAADGNTADSSVVWFQHPGGDGSGTWTVHPIATGIGHEVRLADIDGDGKIDVVTSRTRNINFQNSPTSWSTITWGGGAAGSIQDGMALLDIGTGHGAINIVADNSAGIYWFENPRETGGNARTGTWIAHYIGPNDTGGCILATMDVNGDGMVDILQAPNEAAQGTQGLIWWQAPSDRRNGTWTKHTIDATWQAVHWIEIGDFDGDGHLDFAIEEQEQSHDPSGGPYNYDNDRVGIFYGNGAGGFTPQILETTGGQNEVSGDIDGDGDLDFFSANHGNFGAPHPIELWINNLHPNASGGALSGSVALGSTSTYNLTSLGTADWAHWNGTYVHKASGGGQISDVTQVGIDEGISSGGYGSFNSTSRNVSWSDGTPTSSNGDDQDYIWCNDMVNAGWTFTAPADTVTRTLNVLYGGASGAQVTIVAALSDGSAPMSVNTATISSNTLNVATFTYHAAVAGQYLTVTVNKVGDSGSPSVDLDAAWLTSEGGSGGTLSGSVALGSTSPYNLTSLGTSDWAHWNGTYIHKASGGGQLSNLAQVGSGNYGTFDESARNITWTDGTPTTSGTNDNYYVWCNDKQNAGWTFTAPADTNSRTLNVLYGGASGAVVTISAHLSDDSAPDYSNTQTISSTTLNDATFSYSAASAGQLLTVTVLKVSDSGSPSADLDAAWLTESGSSGTRYEAENLTVAAQTSGVTTRIVDDTGFSNGEAVFFDATATSQYITFDVPAVAAGTYDVRVGVKGWNNKCQWQLAVSPLSNQTDPANVGPVVDTYNANEVYFEADLGSWSPGSTSDKAFRFMVTGKNASSSGYDMAIDYITLIPQ